VASVYCDTDTDHPLAPIDPFSVPGFRKPGIDPENKALCADLEESRSMFY